ncbi:MAG TPA: inorganic diphosphatase [Kofleriaceae bacterium]|nr:inorganic diphosphatase [Kofleriaceae bacterium]
MTSEESWVARIESSDDPTVWVPVINEIACGSCCKYRLDKKTGQLALARAMPPDVSFPTNYGFIPRTRSDADDEETDVLLVSGEPLLPLTIVRARIVGGFLETNSHKRAAEPRLLAVAINDPAVEQIRDLRDIPQNLKARIEAFVLSSKEDQQVEVSFDGWLERAAALVQLQRAFEAAKKRAPK